MFAAFMPNSDFLVMLEGRLAQAVTPERWRMVLVRSRIGVGLPGDRFGSQLPMPFEIQDEEECVLLKLRLLRPRVQQLRKDTPHQRCRA